LKRTTRTVLFFLFFLTLLSLSPQGPQAQSSQETLDQYISDLRRNPRDYALREIIINHVRAMTPAPVVSEEAERYMARGTAAVKNAKNVNDFKDAVNEFEKATLAAPWLAGAYYNLGFSQDKAGMYAEAIKSFKLYLLAAPNASDARAVKTLIYEIEYRQEKKEKESSPQAVAKRTEEKSAAFLRSLDGAVFSANLNVGCYGEYHSVEIQGNEVVFRSRVNRSTCPDQVHTRLGYEDKPWRGTIGIISLGHYSVRKENPLPWQFNEFKVSEDGRTLRIIRNGSEKQFSENPYYRER